MTSDGNTKRKQKCDHVSKSEGEKVVVFSRANEIRDMKMGVTA